MGTWALTQAQALQNAGAKVRVLSFTSWLPRLAGRFSAGARAYAECPSEYQWDDLSVEYPRWLFYQVGPLKRMAYRNPEPQLRLMWLSARGYLRRVMRQFQPDVIFAHHTLVNGYLAARLHEEFQVPFVTLDHDFGEVADCGFLPARKRVFGQIANRAYASVAVAKRMEKSLQELFPSVNACTIHNGVEPLSATLWMEKRPAVMENKIVIFSAGVFYERKGFPLLVRAFAQIAKKHPNAILRIAGDGEQRSQIDQAIAETGISERVQLLGFQSHQHILQEMVWSDAFALIGWDEPFATVFIEAMAAGKPILWASDGGINDVLRDNAHGFALPPRDEAAAARALDDLLSDAALRQRMGNAAQQLFQESLTSQANAKALWTLFENASRKPKEKVF